MANSKPIGLVVSISLGLLLLAASLAMNVLIFQGLGIAKNDVAAIKSDVADFKSAMADIKKIVATINSNVTGIKRVVR